MKRLMFNLTIMLAAFSVGVACQLAFNRYREVTSHEVFDSIPTGPQLHTQSDLLALKSYKRKLPPGTLAAELQRIDEMYRRQCQLPTDWNGDWPTIKQLDRFSVCNDKWAIARRKAIKVEFDKHKVHY